MKNWEIVEKTVVEKYRDSGLKEDYAKQQFQQILQNELSHLIQSKKEQFYKQNQKRALLKNNDGDYIEIERDFSMFFFGVVNQKIFNLPAFDQYLCEFFLINQLVTNDLKVRRLNKGVKFGNTIYDIQWSELAASLEIQDGEKLINVIQKIKSQKMRVINLEIEKQKATERVENFFSNI